MLGSTRDARLQSIVELTGPAIADQYEATATKQHEIGEFIYTAESWQIKHPLITGLEYSAQSTNPRCIVTNLDTEAAKLYEQLYCQRREIENRITEARLHLFGTRASWHSFLANP